MKRVPYLCLLLVLLTACGTDPAPVSEQTEAVPTETEATTEAETEDETEAAAVPVPIEQLPFQWQVTEPDANDMSSIIGSYTNGSEHIVKQLSIQLQINDVDTSYETTMPSIDTVLPGEESTLLWGFGPASHDEEDVTVIGAEYIIEEKERGWIITYDARTDTYDVQEFPRIPEPEPPIGVEQLPFEFVPAQLQTGREVVGIEFTNQSPYTIESFGLAVRATEPNERFGFSVEEAVAPGEESPMDVTLDIESGWELQPLSLIVQVRLDDGSGYFVSYDYKTEEYSTSPLFE